MAALVDVSSDDGKGLEGLELCSITTAGDDEMQYGDQHSLAPSDFSDLPWEEPILEQCLDEMPMCDVTSGGGHEDLPDLEVVNTGGTRSGGLKRPYSSHASLRSVRLKGSVRRSLNDLETIIVPYPSPGSLAGN